MFINPASKGFRVFPQVIGKKAKVKVEVVLTCRFDVGKFDVNTFG